MNDEIAREIVDELRLIREELQNLTMAIRSKASNPDNTFGGKARSPIRRDLHSSAILVTPEGSRPGMYARESHEATGIKLSKVSEITRSCRCDNLTRAVT
jgi:hypothetical protein